MRTGSQIPDKYNAIFLTNNGSLGYNSRLNKWRIFLGTYDITYYIGLTLLVLHVVAAGMRQRLIVTFR